MKRFIRKTLLGLFGGALIVGSLDAAQKEKLGALDDKLQAQRALLRGAGDPCAAFKALFAGDRLDQAGAKKLLEEKTAARQTGNPEVIAAADFFNTLRPEQQQKGRDLMERDTAQPWFGPAPGHRL